MTRSIFTLVWGLSIFLTTGCREKSNDAGQVPRPQSEPPPAVPGAPTPAPPAVDPRAAHDADLARLMTAFGASVKGVQDEASWAEAKPGLIAILVEISEVSKRLKTLPAPTKADFQRYFPKTQAREAELEKGLGNKSEFLGRLPKNVADELGALAGQFFSKMGEAQVLLRGSPPPTKVPAPPRSP